ncbi:chromate reductase [Raineyella antarctica]|uniref:Chromate reductase n=1 Tax=Raineyella antarctica TaxID=1577474 RepID=A0A1G6HRZ1_9ACTN|nr:NADPH-dependent FMN reductase [Raineyella antarctica]SDB96923.1 chromate reductase [Raineyella antarctica]
MTIKVGYFVGSLSAQSINRKVAEKIVELASNDLEFVEIPYQDLPLYNHDLDGDYPQAALDMKAAIAANDAIMFVTPEYNRSVPGALKNAIDWGSRPWGQNAFAGKPAGIVGASIGAPGTSMAQQHLRNILGFLDMPTMRQPEAYVQYEEGCLDTERTQSFLKAWVDAFQSYIELWHRANA